MSNVHIPVLCDAVVEYLLTKQDGIYVDATVGAGGHSSQLLRRLDSEAMLIGIDADANILDIAENTLAAFPQEILLVQTNFSHLGAILNNQNVQHIDGLLMDLGLSSLQIDSPGRGFSYMLDGPLDMRFASEAQQTAASFINNTDEKTLTNIIKKYGEERYAKSIARSIIMHRPMETTTDLREAVNAVTPEPYRIKTMARVFQSIRIHVNRELELLKQTLEASLSLLHSGGRIVVISYHSLEDRIVKQFFKHGASDCVCPPELPQCVCDKEQELRILTRNVVRPSHTETKQNPRARSARLRAAERI